MKLIENGYLMRKVNEMSKCFPRLYLAHGKFDLFAVILELNGKIRKIYSPLWNYCSRCWKVRKVLYIVSIEYLQWKKQKKKEGTNLKKLNHCVVWVWVQFVIWNIYTNKNDAQNWLSLVQVWRVSSICSNKCLEWEMAQWKQHFQIRVRK